MVRRLTLGLGMAVAVVGVWWLFFGRDPPIPVAESPSTSHVSIWPHLRGPGRDAQVEGESLASAWPDTGPPVLWTCELGKGYAGFIVAGGRAYTQFQQLGGQYLICLDPMTGAELWRRRYDWPWQHAGAYPGPYASPTWYNGNVFIAAPSGLVACVDATTGAERWSRNLIREFRGKGSTFGFASTPLVEDGLVILPVGGPGASLVALHAHDGEVAWQAGDDQASYCPALAITFQGRRLVVAYLRNALVLHDFKTGAIVSRMVLSNDYDEHSAWPIYREPDLFLAAPFRLGAQLLGLEQDGADVALQLRWTNPKFSHDVLSSAFHEGSLYGFDLDEMQSRIHRTSRGAFRCIDFATGKERWATLDVGHASVLVADGKLVLLEDTGTLVLARATPTAYEELARHELLPDQGVCWTPPTVWQGRLLVRNHQRAVCVYLGDPARLSEQEHDRARSVSQRFAGRSMDWLQLVGKEPDFPNDAPTWSELEHWYGVTISLLIGALLIACLVRIVGVSSAIAGAIFWALALMLSVAATPFFGHVHEQFVWTWPLSLYLAYQATIDLASRAMSGQRTTPWWRDRRGWLARAGLAAFVLVSFAYFVACQQLGLSILWSFLLGIVPALPVSLVAARWIASPWIRAVLLIVAYTAFFWGAVAIIAWKTSMAEDWLV